MTRAMGWAIWVVIVVGIIQGANETEGDMKDLALERLGLGVKVALQYCFDYNFGISAAIVSRRAA
jgi:hypothetical protein